MRFIRADVGSRTDVEALFSRIKSEYGRAGIRINALCAGTIRTPLFEKALRVTNPKDPSAAERMLTSLIPLGRIGAPEEAAEAIVWLSSESASYVTGHSMIVDGGFSSMMR